MRRLSYVMIIGSFVAFSLLGCGFFGGGSGGGTSSPATFRIRPQYGSPGAFQLDTQTPITGNVTSAQDACNPNSDSWCIRTIPNGAYANTTDGGYIMKTNDVGGVTWSIGAYPSPNCSSGYGSQSGQPNAGQDFPLVCGEATSYFVVTPETYQDTSPYIPDSITFTAASDIFPSGSYTVVATLYDAEGNYQLQGNLTTSSTTSIVVPNGMITSADGTWIVVFRDPGSNTVYGAGAYDVVPTPPPNCTCAPSTPDCILPPTC